MSTQQYINEAKQDFTKAIDHLKEEYRGLQVGRASGSLVEGISVDVYGAEQPLKNIANISIPDAQTVQIKPWDKRMIAPIEKAIQNSTLQLNPTNDGECIRLSIPPLTEERRKDLTKIVHAKEEEAHISIRTARQKAHDKFKQMHKDKEITEDDLRSNEKKLQEEVDKANTEVKELSKKKEKDIMTV